MNEEKLSQKMNQVIDAMEGLNGLFEARLSELKEEGVDEEDNKSLEHGLLAMKDAGRIYLSWTDHYIQRLKDADGMAEMLEEDRPFI